MNIQLRNYTPHLIVLAPRTREEIRLLPSGVVARCQEILSLTDILDVDGAKIPLVWRTFGQIEGLPPREPGVFYVVSTIVAEAAWRQGRDDVVCPGDFLRDSNGRIVGAQVLIGAPAPVVIQEQAQDQERSRP